MCSSVMFRVGLKFHGFRNTPRTSLLVISLFVCLIPSPQQQDAHKGMGHTEAIWRKDGTLASGLGALFAAAALCTVNLCVNGTCYENGGLQICVCDKPYSGALCEDTISMCTDGCGIKPSTGIDCSSALCSLGTCQDTNTEPFYKCDCGDFFTGSNCETHNNPCTNPAANPCGEGTCTFSPGKGSGTVTCTCDSDYETAFGAGMTTVKWGNSEVLQSPPCTVRTLMESFFQAALNSVLEAAGGGTRSTRTSSASSSTSNFGSNRPNSRSSNSGGVPGRSGGNAFRSSRSSERTAATSASSGDTSAMQGSRCEPSSETQARHRNVDQPGQANKTGSSSNVPAGGRTGSSSSSPKGVSAPRDSQDPAKRSQVRDREAADRLKDLGNESFRRGMYGLAAEYYSKAIEVDATVASYFTNRALCHKREKRYPEALEDAEAALALEEANVKGLYIKGDALVQLAKKLRNARWRRQRSVDRKDLEEFLKECIEVAAQQRRLPREEVDGRLAQLEHLVAEAAEADAPFETPDFLTCKISMGLMDEPVVTPSGITYEHKLLLDHLNRNGPTDPLTRRAICHLSERLLRV
ncbi:TPR domain-containing protein, putative [Eimeria mitis]|uniref:RING-type E3 ubiquitin transferase n=1 Tax=Eimeria mitis TaxID=44415 RepID=U6KG54_9EIME|nr:TPR domain-containing protein, putative [Eimeria mitis]CDJ36904.1 TPR domain-containing protein, putative [Eimeria mitis]